jgi:hypothetical protein
MTNELDSLLAALEPEAASAGLPAGWRMEKLMSAVIGPPCVEYVTQQKGNKVQKVLTAESRKLLQTYRTMKWPVLDLRSAEEAERIFSEHALAVHAEQDRLRQKNAPKVNTAAPEYSGQRPLRIVRI